jgi:ZIP family zinc transporter
MSELLKTTLLGLFFGTFGTTLGGIIGVKFKNPSNKFLSFILSLASGLMTAILSFDLIPEALKISNIQNVIIGIVIGIICMILCNILVDKKFTNNTMKVNRISNNEKSELLRVGIITSVGLAIHNFPEGLAIGSGFSASTVLGFSLAIAICVHDIPEGISMAIPMKNGGMKTSKVILYVILSGVTTGVGAFVGKIIGGISQNVIAICLSFAAGAMLYIVSGELIPESNKLHDGKVSTLGTIIGFILGLLAVNI